MTAPPAPRRLATITQVMDYLQCDRRTIERRLGEGKLTRYRNGRRVLIDLNEVDAMIRPYHRERPANKP